MGARLHVTGGALKGGRGIEGEASVAGMHCQFFRLSFLQSLIYKYFLVLFKLAALVNGSICATFRKVTV